MRDKLKGEKYFKNFISEDSKRIKKFSHQLKMGKVAEERIFPVKAEVHNLKLGVMIAQYSRGDSVAVLEKEYLQLVGEWEEVFEADYYNKNLKMISLAVLFGVDSSILERIKLLLQKANINDWLFDFLLNMGDDEMAEATSDLLFPRSYGLLKKAVYAENKVELLKRYLIEAWYHRDCGCYEAHKSEQNIYYGYWSFEAGAVAKILKLDDDDLIHYRE